ncbi:MAG TPA: protein kinase [Gemmataceae bacterium]|nr:protein kinase [Gemmataceae bacterium]
MTQIRHEQRGPLVATDPDDPRVIAAMEEYLAELEAGRTPDRRRFLARHPEIAAALTECLDGLAFLHAAAPSLHAPNEPDGLTPPGLPGEAEQRPLGDFQLGREIGRGGMGVVYEATQLSLGRRVALKVLPLAATLDPKHLQRFQREAQAAAQLHHTNIVPVYAVGCERSVHYYAMQLIEGRSLAALIEEMRATRDEERGARIEDRGSKAPKTTTVIERRSSILDPQSSILARRRSAEFFRTAARLAMKAAEALEHAHQLAIVHRDIKPANLLVDVRGNLWVTDFGLALFQSDANLTITGEVLGTLRYMSPEQALGKRGVVDHRTDIYSLGMTLYELLTLRPAFDGQDRQELLTQIGGEEPRPPRRIDPSIPVELETIVLKAIAKNPAERYGTAQELADDLQRFLDNRPIFARRPTLRDRACKWARRHRGLVASAVALLLVAVAGLVVAMWFIAQEHTETRAAYERERRQAESAREQRVRAEENFRAARQAVDLLSHIGEEDLANLPPALESVRRRMLEATLGYYQDFLERRQDPSIQAELEASRARVTRLLDELTALQSSGQLELLKQSSIQKELKLTADQRARVEQVAERIKEQWHKLIGEFRNSESEERRARSLKVAREEEGAIAETLDSEQAKRFRQLLLQMYQRGPYGFADPELVATLQLTTKQREKIRNILQTAYQPPWEVGFAGGPRGKGGDGYGKGGKGTGRPPPRPQQPSWASVHEKIMKELTLAQREKWRELTGEPLLAEVRITPLAGSLRFGPSWMNRAPGPMGWLPGPGRP